MYRDTNWNNARVNQPVVVCQESSAISKPYDPYSCKITITRPDRVGAVTVGHIPREISRYVHYFLLEGGSVTGIVADVHHRLSPIPEGGLEIPIHMPFSIRSKAILEKIKNFVEAQITQMGEVLTFEDDEDADDDCPGEHRRK